MVAEDCLEKGLYKDAINRSYYAAFYAIKASLALEEVEQVENTRNVIETI